MAKKYWLMKSEADVYSIDDLKKDGTTWWEGVRNYQARNFMMNDMSVGDCVLVYHSNSEPTGVVGLATVSQTAQPDKTQFDSKSDYYDPKATKERPVWFCVQVKFLKKLKTPITLHDIKNNNRLRHMLVVKRGMRLSIQPVTEVEYSFFAEGD